MALSGPNSRRRLGTASGAMRRESRRLDRGGNRAAAGAMALHAAEQRLTEGSAITSSEATIREDQLRQASERGLTRQKRDSLLKPEASGADPSGGTQIKKAIDLPGGRTAASGTPSLGGRPSASYDSDNNGIPNSLQRPASPLQGPPAPIREGRINGVPASQAIGAVEKPAQFGAGYATQNIERLGLAGAIADYRRREADAAKPAEPGNLAEANARDFVGPKQSPLSDAMNSALARNAERATDSVAAGKLTAGLNTAPTPKLDTSFPTPAPVTATAAVPAATPAAPVNPALPRSGAYRLGSTIHNAVADFMKSPDYSKEKPAFSPATIQQPQLKKLELTPEAAAAADALKKKVVRPTLGAGRDFTQGLFTSRR